MSKILVIGTSPVMAVAKKEDGTERIDIKDRWQHLIGLEVETLARSGATSFNNNFMRCGIILRPSEKHVGIMQ